ncbi:hypothetical protein [Methylophaga nitratireducenticrescens]|uniref:hypothetical protein n=1 Tax=Methylophaga nitratireducenticrescens TaxID=754476 RepID=UPI000CDBCC72|nr:hypothetical protein [Methylophaga nitratireducenticrescens]AUZ85220.1 hypothetical protein CDW43_11850 [Methylophaga nitratireducenticrescens]
MSNKSKVTPTKSPNDPESAVDDSTISPKSSVEVSDKEKTKKDKPRNERDLILNHEDAQAASPDDMAACGEEDVGAGLEFLVTKNDHHK